LTPQYLPILKSKDESAIRTYESALSAGDTSHGCITMSLTFSVNPSRRD